MKSKELLKTKILALEYFIHQLLNTRINKNIGKIFLFGSVLKKQVRDDSDIDILIFCLREINAVLNICADLQMKSYFRYSESIEPIVYPIEMMRNPNSYFLYKIIKSGKEVYSMKEKELRTQEAKNYIILAEEYLEGAKENFDSKRIRISVDTGYNSAELCVKGLILLETEEIPSSHGGIVGEFGKLYIKTDKLPKEIGRQLNKALSLRNKAKYVYNAEIDTQDAEEIIKLSEDLIKRANEYLK